MHPILPCMRGGGSYLPKDHSAVLSDHRMEGVIQDEQRARLAQHEAVVASRFLVNPVFERGFTGLNCGESWWRCCGLLEVFYLVTNIVRSAVYCLY